MRDKPAWWWVTSPVYESRGDDWYDPPEPGCDVLAVFTTTKQRAKVLAVRAWRRGWRNGLREHNTVTARPPWVVTYDDEHPMKVRAERDVAALRGEREEP